MKFADCCDFYRNNILNNDSIYFRIILFSILAVPFLELFGEAIYNVPFFLERTYLTFLGLAGCIVFGVNFFIQGKLFEFFSYLSKASFI